MGRFIEVALLLVALGRVDGESYLLSKVYAVDAIAGESGGYFLVDLPQLGYNVTRTVAPYSRNFTTISPLELASAVETKAFVLHAIYKDMSIYATNGSALFSLLPISALGSRYVVSTCLGFGNTNRVMLLIVNYNQKTDVDITLVVGGYVTYNNITYNDGDTIHVSLNEYQTFTLKSAYDLTGTVVNTTRDVAVFSGTLQGRYVRAVAQLFPVRHHGTEFVLSTYDSSNYRNYPYQLQVVSDHRDTEIRLNNGSTFSLGDNRVYRQDLLYNETLYFNTTRPVIATLCRKPTYVHNQGFVVVTPVKYFMNTSQVYVAFCINILTKQHVTDIEVFGVDKIPANVDWVDIPGSDYKAGIACSNGLYFVRSANRFTVYAFQYDITNGGYRFPTDPPTTPAATGESYLLSKVYAVDAVAGESGGFFLVDLPQLGYNVTRTVAPYSRNFTTISPLEMASGVETKAFVLHAIYKDMSIYATNGSALFSLLPISALGSRYVVSTCRGVSYTNRVMLLIVNYNQKTDVDITLVVGGYVTYNNITYNDGDTIHVSLDEYQTFMLKSAYDLTGTIINTTRDVAVFSGTLQGRYVRAVAQLFPVRHHGTEFVLSTHDSSNYRNYPYQLQVVSDHTDTEIKLNNGSTFSLGDNRVYRQDLLYNETLYFNTTRPVIATLCRKPTYVHNQGFVVVTPVKYFMNTSQVYFAFCINILTKQHVTDIEVFGVDKTPTTVDWVDIPGSDYKAGIACSNGLYFVRSANRFTVYAFQYDITNGGYRFPTDPPTTPAAAGTTASGTTTTTTTITTTTTTTFAVTTTSGTTMGGFTTESTDRSSPESTSSHILVGMFMGGVAAGAVIVILVGLTAYVLVIRRRYDLTVKKQGDIPASVEHPSYSGLSAGADINTYAIIGQTSRSQEDTTHGSSVTPDYQTI